MSDWALIGKVTVGSDTVFVHVVPHSGSVAITLNGGRTGSNLPYMTSEQAAQVAHYIAAAAAEAPRLAAVHREYVAALESAKAAYDLAMRA